MIELYTWGTPNGRKVSIMLEECGLPYSVHAVNIGKDEQFKPEFLAISPNNRIPAIVDPEGPDGKPLSCSSRARSWSTSRARRAAGSCPPPTAASTIALQWLMFQMGGVGPMFGQAHHFMRAKKDEIPYGTERYGDEAKRLYGVLTSASRRPRTSRTSIRSPTSPPTRGWRGTSGTAWTSRVSRGEALVRRHRRAARRSCAAWRCRPDAAGNHRGRRRSSDAQVPASVSCTAPTWAPGAGQREFPSQLVALERGISSTPPTSTARARTRSWSAAPSAVGVTTSSSRPSSARGCRTRRADIDGSPQYVQAACEAR